jgi:hypothetical protein
MIIGLRYPLESKVIGVVPMKWHHQMLTTKNLFFGFDTTLYSNHSDNIPQTSCALDWHTAFLNMTVGYRFPLESKVIGLDPMNRHHKRLVEVEKFLLDLPCFPTSRYQSTDILYIQEMGSNDSYHHKGSRRKRGKWSCTIPWNAFHVFAKKQKKDNCTMLTLTRSTEAPLCT